MGIRPLQTAFRERQVRRELRHVAADGRRRHSRRLVWWTLAMLPQVCVRVRVRVWGGGAEGWGAGPPMGGCQTK